MGVFRYNMTASFGPFSELGENNLIQRGYRNATMLCMTDTILLEVSKDLYNKILLWDK